VSGQCDRAGTSGYLFDSVAGGCYQLETNVDFRHPVTSDSGVWILNVIVLELPATCLDSVARGRYQLMKKTTY
jgi:hypothetical protein